MGSGSLTPSEIAISRKFPASLNGAVIQIQAKAVLTAAAIGTMKESAVQEEKRDVSVFMQNLKSICDLEENKKAVLFS